MCVVSYVCVCFPVTISGRGEDVDKIAQEYDPKDEEGALMHHMKDLGMIPASSGVTLPVHTTVESKQ